MNQKRNFITLIAIISIFIILPLSVSAHSGRTDSSGGHHDYKNASGLGSYHYHHGYPAHLHPGGVCPYGGSNANSYVSTPPSVSVSNTPSELYIGDTSGFSYTVQNGANSSVNVSSSDENVVKVNEDHTLTAVNEGTATITVSYSIAKQSFTVTVRPVPVLSIEIVNAPTKIQLNNSQKIEAKVLPDNATNKTISWSSNDETIISISKDGIIKGKKVGKTNIICTANNGVKTEIPIEVYEVFPNEIEIDTKFIRLECKSHKNVRVKILPENANNKNYKITIKDSNIARISSNNDNNIVTALKDGKTRLIVKTDNGVKKEIPVTVFHVPVSNIKIVDDNIEYKFKSFSSNTIFSNCTVELPVKIEPDYATYNDVIWTSSNNNIISIDNGEFIINGYGEVELTANTFDNVKSTIQLNVIDYSAIVFLIFDCVFFTCLYAVIIVCKKKNIEFLNLIQK